MDRKLAFGTELYHKRANYQSIGNLYDEVRSGAPATCAQKLEEIFPLMQGYTGFYAADLDGKNNERECQ